MRAIVTQQPKNVTLPPQKQQQLGQICVEEGMRNRREEENWLGADAPMKRAGETYEIAPLFVYLASDDSSYVTGQTMHINGGLYKG